ncbi:uncharacterized protein LACBIDRAFT_295936 [Laccaria bicolor S238N-H82]|uniref:Predicted protein n=1 Tax=Laccaria bicolor (strain S238N-H82 / ATCC MYA-4686) TaxID=486041 RepID=B0E0I4_LACBS|nr:uncharacterized protein LACBIDRAFT_295936 [Laccaria bicolor S238N-H82]EDQ99625.1 predicted protein [Laccaria bicolor S238N-H82]|eukprot:XP_001889736.1 predicted protein [Laccaria bicolor S238N-H82]
MPANNNDTDLQRLQPHHTYYIMGGDLHFLVEKTLFRVHSYFFIRDSVKFNKILQPSATAGQFREGSESNPIVIPDISPDDFATFLWVFYNPKYTSYDHAPVESWVLILKLAHKWEFVAVKDCAARQLETKTDISVAERLRLYQEVEVDSDKYIVPLFKALCKRDIPLTLEESKLLGIETVYLISTAREKLRAVPSDGGKSPLPRDLEDEDVTRTILNLLDPKAANDNQNGLPSRSDTKKRRNGTSASKDTQDSTSKTGGNS